MQIGLPKGEAADADLQRFQAALSKLLGETDPTAKILLADHNFGCGSSREHAVWALTSWGFEVVIAKSFADIFFNNSAKSGLLLIKLPDAKVDQYFAKAATGLVLTVDLERQIIMEGPPPADRDQFPFDYDPFRKHCLLNGLDDIGLTLQKKNFIGSYEDKIKKERPWL